MNDWTDEKIAEMNEFMKTIISIGSETKHFKVEGDPFTKWDSQYINITKYVDGRVERHEGRIDKDASKRLHRINSILEDWGFKRQNFVGGHWDDKFYWHIEGESVVRSFTVNINIIHRDRFKVQTGEYEYYDYEWDDKTVEEFFDKKIESFIEKNAGPVFKRDLKIRKILK